MTLSEKIQNEVRKGQTSIELGRLADEVECWIERRKNKDEKQQHQTQLNALGMFLNSAVSFLQTSLGQINTNQPRAEVYETCRLFDMRVLWLWKVWRYFKDKFDQRDDESLGPLLRAADEVVWSCYRQIFSRAEAFALDIPQGVAPLPFVESAYSPESFPSELVPHALKPGETGFLNELIAKLPIPLVSLPQSCVRAPWWLVYIGHEVGHHIQYAIAPESRMVDLFKKAVEQVVSEQPLANGDDAEKWGFWAKEIFADVFSVLMMGPWAVWAMVEFEIKKADAMSLRRPQYPAPAVRLWLLAQTGTKLGFDGEAALRGLDPKSLVKGNETAERDLAFAEPVVEMALDFKAPGKGVSLKSLANFRLEDFQPQKTVDGWSSALRGEAPALVEQELRSARLVASGAVAAWAAMVETWDKKQVSDQDRTKQLDEMANLAKKYIAQSSEAGSRSPSSAQDLLNASESLGGELAARLINADPQELAI